MLRPRLRNQKEDCAIAKRKLYHIVTKFPNDVHVTKLLEEDDSMAISDQDRGLLVRTILILAFPALKVAYTIFDVVCFVFQHVCRCLGCLLRIIYGIVETFIRGLCKSLEKLGFGPAIKYQKLRDTRKANKDQQHHQEPLPYENEFCRRFLTHTGGLLLGLVLYVFVYIVLVKHHSVHSIAVAFVVMLPYMLVLENSHAIRAIMMLGLPIMFTNRGRALVFCCMLAIMAAGPLKNSQANIKELHKSLNCSKQYMILRTDDYVEENVVRKLMRVEHLLQTLVDDIKQFGREVRERMNVIIELALTVNRYIEVAIEKLLELVDVCNSKTPEYIANCTRQTNSAYRNCKSLLGSLGMMCELIRPAGQTHCESINWPAKFCEISKSVVLYVEKNVKDRLDAIKNTIRNMLYVEVEIDHSYYFNGTKSKSFKQVISEIKFDVEHKFWYIHFVVRVFNLIALILVIWITLTATLYHMHYMDEISYDNMYLDARIVAIDEHRKRRMATKNKEPGNKLTNGRTASEPSYTIFPLAKEHERQYLKPFGIWMNEMERHKLIIAGLVWLIIVNYIAFFVALDFGLYHLIELINQILNDILFKSDLPLIDVSSKSGPGQVVHYNRTYISQLRLRTAERASRFPVNGTSMKGVGGLYRRLMDSVEKNIPDDVMILDSMQECLPKSSQPNFRNYKNLAYLAALTFGGVILEAYALRLRHWIANLYYPGRANKRSLWLYRKILAEKPKYERDHRTPELVAAEMLGLAIKR